MRGIKRDKNELKEKTKEIDLEMRNLNREKMVIMLFILIERALDQNNDY